MKMDIMSFSNLFSDKGSMVNKNVAVSKGDKQVFAEAFKKERETLDIKNQKTFPKSVNHENHTKNSITREKNSSDTSNKPMNANKEVSQNENEKISSKEAETTKKADDLTNEESEEKAGDLENSVLNEIAALLQSLLALTSTDDTNIEQGSILNLELNTVDMTDLVDLKDQLTLLLNSLDIEENQPIMQRIGNVLSMVTKIIDGGKLSDGKLISAGEEAISEDLLTLQEVKSNIETLINDLNLKNNKNMPNLDSKVNEKLTKVENDLFKSDNTVLDEDADVESAINKISNLDKSLENEGKENQDFIKQQGKQENMIINNDILSFQQDKIDQRLAVDVMKNEIIEPKQFISEIAQKAGAFLSKDKTEMNIQLTPEHLGKISIKIGLNEGTLTGKIYAENFSVKEIIEANLNQLRQSLEEKGLNIAGLEVHIGDESKNFERNLYQSKSGNTQKSKKINNISSNAFVALEQNADDINPYLTSGQFDGLA